MPAQLPAARIWRVQIREQRRRVGTERERIAAWIRNRLIAYPLASCLLCRKPIIAGQDWQEASNGEARARFHRACHIGWRSEQEVAVRQALGLEG